MSNFTKVKDLDLYICEFLDDASLARVRRTCKYFNELLEDSSFWRRRCLYNIIDCDVSILKCELSDSYSYYKQTILGTIKTFKRWKKSWNPSNNRNNSLMTEIHKTVCRKYASDSRVDLLTLMETCDLHDIIEKCVDGDYWKDWPTNGSSLVVNAVVSGSMGVLDWLYVRGYLSDLTYTKHLPWIAMRFGNIITLNWLKEKLNVVPVNYKEVSNFCNYLDMTKHREFMDLAADIKAMTWSKLNEILRWLLRYKIDSLIEICEMLLTSNHFENVVLWVNKNKIKFDMYMAVMDGGRNYDVTEIIRRYEILYNHGYRVVNPVAFGLTCVVLSFAFVGLTVSQGKNVPITGETYDYNFSHITDWMVSKRMFARN